jgi:hypothetical protein
MSGRAAAVPSRASVRTGATELLASITDDSRRATQSELVKTPTEEAAVKFMLFTYRDPNVQLTPEQRATVPAAVGAWCDEMDARGVRLTGHVLAPLSETRTIRIREGDLRVEEGPVSEQTFQIAGFNILECADVDEAIEVASKNPGASFGVLELRSVEE